MAENKELSSVIQIDTDSYNVNAVNAEKLGGVAAADYAKKSDLFSKNYNDLTNKPTIPTVNNAKLTIQKNGAEVATFTANSASDVVANISVPTITDNLTSTSTTAALSAAQGKILNDTKQAKLDSGTNIKTINGQSLLGSGDITITTGGGTSDVASKIKVTMKNNTTANATITINDSDPNGGVTGDIWFKY